MLLLFVQRIGKKSLKRLYETVKNYSNIKKFYYVSFCLKIKANFNLIFLQFFRFYTKNGNWLKCVS